MSPARILALVAIAILPAMFACSDPAAPIIRDRSRATAPSVALVTGYVSRIVTAEEFALADEDNAFGICVKATPSADLLMKDANAATPSQPCPPAWQFLGTPMTIFIQHEWFTEDKNANGTVCVKFVGGEKTIVKDDNASTPSQPCPPAFSPVGQAPSGPQVDAEDLQAADQDGDKMVCVNPVASGNFIVRDDNNATPSQPCPPSWYLYTSGTMEPPPAEEQPPKD